MSRILFLLAIAVVIYFLLRNLRRPRTHDTPTPPPAEDMVSCARCGVNLPRSEALAVDDHYYCSPAHRDA